MAKELLFTLTAKDFDFQYYRGSGKGGQKRNKTSNCCRCTHRDSGAVAIAEHGRSQLHNKQEAFGKCVATKEFKAWHKLEVSRRTGETARLKEKIDKYVDDEINNPKHIKIEYYEPKD